MLYCPRCRKAYDTSTGRCVECAVALVDEYFNVPCPYCRHENRINRTVCWTCGRDLAKAHGLEQEGSLGTAPERGRACPEAPDSRHQPFTQERAEVQQTATCVEGEVLRPALLGVITVFYIFLASLCALGAVLSAARAPGALAGLPLYIGVIVAFLGLRYGKRWAWVGAKVLCGIGTVVSLAPCVAFLAIATPRDRKEEWGLVLLLFVNAAILVSVWLYLRSDAVKSFCGVRVRREPKSL